MGGLLFGLDMAETNLEELRIAVKGVDLPAEEVGVLVRHLQDRFVGHFGAESFDVWQAKWGLHSHGVEELALLTVVKLAPLLEALPEGVVTELANDQRLGSPIRFPWEDRY